MMKLFDQIRIIRHFWAWQIVRICRALPNTSNYCKYVAKLTQTAYKNCNADSRTSWQSTYLISDWSWLEKNITSRKVLTSISMTTIRIKFGTRLYYCIHKSKTYFWWIWLYSRVFLFLQCYIAVITIIKYFQYISSINFHRKCFVISVDDQQQFCMNYRNI